MNPVTKLVRHVSKHARARRAAMFRDSFVFGENTKILDLGSESGSNVYELLKGTAIQPKNVYVADIVPEMVKKGSEVYGFIPVVISETGDLPFEDNFFDIVYCSSVIEHVTVNKNEIWKIYSSSKFRIESIKRQSNFAQNIKRAGQQYFVQTPNRYFPIESHSWLPFIGWLPRWLLLPVLHTINLFWIKKTQPDWYLLNKKELSYLFDDAEIIDEKFFGINKSLVAIKTNTVKAEKNATK